MPVRPNFTQDVALVRELQSWGIEPDPAVERAIALREATAQARGIDPGAQLRAAYLDGSLTVDNLVEHLFRTATFTGAKLSGAQGQPLALAALVVEHLTEQTVEAYLTDNVDHFVEVLSGVFNEHAEVINKLGPKALPDGATPEMIIEGGKPALAAREKVQQAGGQLSSVRYLIDRVRQNAGLAPLSFANLIDPASVSDDQLDHFLTIADGLGWVDYVRQGFRLLASTGEEAADLGSRILAHKQAQQAEADYQQFAVTELRLATTASGRGSWTTTEPWYRAYVEAHPEAQPRFYAEHPELPQPYERPDRRRPSSIVVR
jgi:hypothetical protein